MNRRSLLKGLAVASLCSVCLSVANAETGHAKHWTYEGAEGPEFWGSLESNFKACSQGVQQSPVDLPKPIASKVDQLKVEWDEIHLDIRNNGHIPLDVSNNGHTIQVNIPAGNWVEYGGQKYTLKQFHFHHPSEHKVEGKSAEMEIHFVHLSEKGDAAVVLGVMVVPGAANPALEAIWESMPKASGAKAVSDEKVDIEELLPKARGRFVYEGSLTTPPCSEIIHWQVFREAITASPEQIKAFSSLFPNNARPVQPLNRRFVLGD